MRRSKTNWRRRHETSLNEGLGRTIADHREKLGITQTVMAVHMDTSQSTLCLLETGSQHWTMDRLELAAAILDVDAFKLVAEAEVLAALENRGPT